MQDETSNNPSSGHNPEAAEILRFGPFRVSAGLAEVEAFRHATGWPETANAALGESDVQVPHTFPMRWLTSPDIWSVLEEKVQNAGGVVIHESQSFTYEKPLRIGQDYVMTASVDENNPLRLIVRACVSTLGDEPCLQIETILRIISGGSAS